MGRLSDKRVAILAREYLSIRGELLAELAARRVTTVEVDGVKVSARTNKIKTWDVAGLAKQLSRSLQAKIIVRRVDARALARAVKSGDVPQAIADAAILSETESSPFLEVTLKG